MKQRFKATLYYFLFWFLSFYISRVLFLLFQHSLTSSLTWLEIMQTFIYGVKLDVSMTSYFCVLFVLIIAISFFIKIKYLKPFVSIINVVLFVLVSILVIGDAMSYKYWGFRLDASPLMYIKTPGEMAASLPTYQVILGVLAILTLIGLFWISFRIFVLKQFKKIDEDLNWRTRIIGVLVFLLLDASFIIPIRGGFDLSPINVASVYFSPNIFANHAAINVSWNFSYSLTMLHESENDYEYMKSGESDKIIESLYENNGNASKSVLNTKRPNVILIMVESLSGNNYQYPQMIPELLKLSKEGIYFSNFYSSGVRTEKGLAAIISGFPAQPQTTVIRNPQKSQNLPFISSDLKKNGYYTSFFYGGSVVFVNIKSFLVNGEYQHIESQNDFTAKENSTKWGVHDGIVFNRVISEIKKMPKPFFTTVLTLSSHEPFDVPYSKFLSKKTDEELYLNAVAYTDSCIGDFVKKLKKENLWDNTLLIITADHAANHPGKKKNHQFRRFQIPLIWTGGAVKSPFVNTVIGSQTDISITLLNQLDIKPQKTYRYSKDLFQDSVKSFAYMAFNTGFGFVTDTASVTVDINNLQPMDKKGKYKSVETYNKAYLQDIMNTYYYLDKPKK